MMNLRQWDFHPRPWRLVRGWKVFPNGEPLDAVLDAQGECVCSSFGVGFKLFWESYLSETQEGKPDGDQN